MFPAGFESVIPASVYPRLRRCGWLDVGLFNNNKHFRFVFVPQLLQAVRVFEWTVELDGIVNVEFAWKRADKILCSHKAVDFLYHSPSRPTCHKMFTYNVIYVCGVIVTVAEALKFRTNLSFHLWLRLALTDGWVTPVGRVTGVSFSSDYLSLLQSSDAYQTSMQWATLSLSPRARRQGCDARAEDKNEWSYTSAALYDIMSRTGSELPSLFFVLVIIGPG